MDVPIHEGKGVGPRVLLTGSSSHKIGKFEREGGRHVTESASSGSIKREFVSLIVDGPFLPWPFF